MQLKKASFVKWCNSDFLLRHLTNASLKGFKGFNAPMNPPKKNKAKERPLLYLMYIFG